MFYLLRLDGNPRPYPLPIADLSAEALEAVLLHADPSGRQLLLTELLERDPAIALWACAACARNGQDLPQPATARIAAERLGANLAERLAGSLVDPELQGVEVDADEAAQFAVVLARVGERAGAAAEAAASATARQKRSAARVRHRVHWSVMLSSRQELLELLPSKRSTSPDQRLLPGFPAAVNEPNHFSDQRPGPSDRDQSRYFQEESRAVASRLPALIARLAPLEHLAANYQTQLEEEKLASIKELAYGAGHEINNPLANIAARAQTLARDEADPRRQKMLTAMHRQAMRAHEMIADLMLFARPPELVPERCDLGAIVRRAAAELTPQAEHQETKLVLQEYPGQIELAADSNQLTVAIKAVMANALEAVASGGQVDVEVDLRPGRPGWAAVIVRDDGPGISPRAARHLFDPFFSGREAGRGLGFGLCKCWRIVTAHGGRISAANRRQSGAAFTIQLPLRESSPVSLPARYGAAAA